MAQCKCEICKRGRRLTSIIKMTKSSRDSEFLQKVHSDLLNAEFDLDVYKLRLETVTQ